MKKYNLSLKRIFSRVFLTGVVGVVFGIAMFPFMTVADGLLFEQRAAIGNQNMMKMVALWGIFTLIVTLITFWKKRFRMVSVLLIICWFISIGFYVLLASNDEGNLRCQRSAPYQVEKEFNRAMDLISQRLDVKNHRADLWSRAFDYRNCLEVQYSELNTEIGTEGLFLEEDPTLQDMKILVNPKYKEFDDLTIATILMHGITHAGQYVNRAGSEVPYTEEDCYVDEAQAFTSQAIFLDQLNQEERRSIFTRLNQSIEANPAFAILIGIDKVKNEAYQACDKLRVANSLTDQQFNECVWTGTQNKLLVQIKADPYYQEQCRGNAGQL